MRCEFEIGVITGRWASGLLPDRGGLCGWAKNNGVPVGPDGSACGASLVAYSLGITDLDPRVQTCCSSAS